MSDTRNERLERYLDDAAGDLPTLPMIASNVMRISEDPKATASDLVRLIEQDTGIATRILKVSNSSLYGFPSRIQNLTHAITLLGFRAVRNLALAASMKNTYQRFGLMEKLLWEHSAMAGPVAAALSRSLDVGIDADDAFTAGLLHDIGKTALANSHHDEYEAVITRVYNERVRFVEAETDHFGFHHAALGAAVAERWQLPSVLASLIRHHHDPEAWSSLPEDQGRFVALISLSTALLTHLGVGRREPALDLDLASLPAWEFLELDKERAGPLVELCRTTLDNAVCMLD